MSGALGQRGGGQLRPTRLRVEAATVCQLRCPSCPTTQGTIQETLGAGVLAFATFRHLVEESPWIRAVELSNWGEMLLNPHLVEILRYADQKQIALHADNGVNLNTATDEVLEALVRYRLRSMTCSIDGASQETYQVYRRGGRFARVLQHLRTLTAWKPHYHSPFPRLVWQFVIFGHNEHEIPAARRLARELGMRLFLKLSWDETFSPVRDPATIRRVTGLGVASRSEYRRRYPQPYLQRGICTQLWNEPQVNWDGRVLGCCVNHWGDFGNALTDGLQACLDGEKMAYARQMVLGRAPARPGIPCTHCPRYRAMQTDGRWISRWDVWRMRLVHWLNQSPVRTS